MTRILAILLLIWAVAAALNIEVHLAGPAPDTPVIFPLSIFLLQFHGFGIKYLIPFLLLLLLALRFADRLGPFGLWLVALLLIVTGNLVQGSIDLAFYQPFTLGDLQYYHEALKITDGGEWLAAFTQDQPRLLVHTRTHPPFVTLIHYGLLQAPGGGVPLLAATFVLIASLSVPLIYATLGRIGIEGERLRLLTLLFATLPAVNIYTGVSLDGMILTASLVWLYGAVRVLQEGPRPTGIAAMAAGLLWMNLLTYAGVFLIAVSLLMAAWGLLVGGRRDLITAALLPLAIALAAIGTLDPLFGYNHAVGFLNASRLENPGGFYAIAEPWNYVLTRIEGVMELGVFLSFGTLAWLLHRRDRLTAYRDPATALALAALITLGAMLLSGALRTGETARACLYLYPYLLLLIRDTAPDRLRQLITIAGVQTGVMQLFGFYYW